MVAAIVTAYKGKHTDQDNLHGPLFQIQGSKARQSKIDLNNGPLPYIAYTLKLFCNLPYITKKRQVHNTTQQVLTDCTFRPCTA